MSLSRKINILIADDHEFFSKNLKEIIGKIKHPDNTRYEIFGSVNNGLSLLTKLAFYHTNIDIVISDIMMPVMDGVECTSIIKRKYPKIKVIALSMYDRDDLIEEMFKAGASGYLLKNTDLAEISEALRRVSLNSNHFCQAASKKLVSLLTKHTFSTTHGKTLNFSQKEIDIIKLICKQYTSHEIAEKTFLSKRTVEGYRAKIQEKMDVKSSVGIAIFAVKHNIIKDEELH